LQEWQVPAGVSSATFEVAGAGGGGGGIPLVFSHGGGGALATSTFAVSEGTALKLVVGGGGASHIGGESFGGGATGGTTGFGGAAGGGGSFVFSSAGSLLIAAGGGGGGGTESDGGNAGLNGSAGTTLGPSAGGGATQSSGGSAGEHAEAGHGPTTSTAIQGRGGKGATELEGGGGGGGGYYGGGGGGAAFAIVSGGGGGGSSVVNGGSSTTIESGKGGAGGSERQNGQGGHLTLTFAQPTMGVALSASTEEANVAETVTFTATVSPVPTSGTVAFEEGGSSISGCGAATVSLVTGKAACTTEFHALGAHHVTAKYSGSTDQIYRVATSSSREVTARQPTSVSLEASNTSPLVGEAVTYRALVAPTPTSGTVAFSDGASPIAGCQAQTVNTTTGIATCQVTYSNSGTHAITAAFSGSVDTLYEAANTAGSTGVTVSAKVSASTAETPAPVSAPVQVTVGKSSPSSPAVVLTREPKGLINIRLLKIVFRCGSTPCSGFATLVVGLPGGRSWTLTSNQASAAAGKRGRAWIGIPARLRHAVRRYLVGHRRYSPRLEVSVTITSTGSAPQTTQADLGVWTLPGFR
jgi:Bacterial Ig-like domain (group 3)